MDDLFFTSALNPLTGGQQVLAVFNGSGPLSAQAASWTPLFYLPEDAPCSLGRAVAQFAAAHPTSPDLVLNTTILTGPVNGDPGAWQPQGFYARVSSVKDGLLFEGQRLYDHGTRRNPIRSFTKALTSAAFMALTEEGHIALDDLAGDYVPAFKTGQLASITFRMLLSHTSGLPFVTDAGEALLNPSITLMESATLIAEQYPLVYAPGTGFNYTELDYQVVGAAMEAVTGASFQSIVERHITGPIGMTDTKIYNQWKNGFSTNPNCAFGGVASPNDLWAFTNMLLNRGVVTDAKGRQRRVLSEASVLEIVTPQPMTSGFQTNLVAPVFPQYIEPLVLSGVLDPAAALVMSTVCLGSMEYGLGVPLSQVKDGVARNVVIIGGAGQVYLITNYHEPSKALVAGASNFQNQFWGYLASAALISEVLAELPAGTV